MVLNNRQIASLVYHNRYQYPLTLEELTKWELGSTIRVDSKLVSAKDGYFFVKGQGKIVDIRKRRQKASEAKLRLLEKYKFAFGFFPSTRFVGVTGSLAMHNADVDSDIDLMIITSKNTLWVTRGLLLVFLRLLNIPVRKAGDPSEKNKLCLNLWLDENSLAWPKGERNVYTAHEIAQVVPVKNNKQAHQRFLLANSWVLDYWPKSLVLPRGYLHKQKDSVFVESVLAILNTVAFWLQYWYMKAKITNEKVSLNKAVFHPNKL